MAWIRLYVVVEGQTERKFAEDVLKPHLAQFKVDVRAILVTTNRKLYARGGINNYALVKNDLERRMRQDRNPEAHFTTMLDLYGLPNDFPGRAEARKGKTPQERAAILERSLQNDLPGRRFIPYIQLHEFEALLYCDLTQLAQRISNSKRALTALANEVEGIAPEDINEGAATAPSKRIIRHVPLYEKLKVRVGAAAAAAIGLPLLRTHCPHFDSWVTQLEGLSGMETQRLV
jgi:hypothetical protein